MSSQTARLRGRVDSPAGEGRFEINYTPNTNDTDVYLVATPNVAAGTSYSIYQPIANDDFASGTDTVGTLTVGEVTTGVINESGDFDGFAFEVEAGQVLDFTLTYNDFATLPHISVSGADGLFATELVLTSVISDAGLPTVSPEDMPVDPSF